ncbi:MAG TPA: AAA family ATPase, partial [Cyanophyceae cyanobacterium]
NVVALLDQKRVYETMLQQRAAEVIGGSGISAPLTPSRISADSSLDPARQQLANQLINLETQRDTLIEQLEATKRTEQQLRREYQVLPNKQLEQARLQQQVTLKQGYYTRYQTSLADAKAAEIETVSSLALSQAPEVTKVGGEGNNPAIILGAGGLIGALVGAGIILVLSTLDNTLYTAEDIRSILAQNDVALLGELPLVQVISSDQGETGILANPDSPYLDYYERFRSKLRGVGDKPVKVVLLISMIENEGKTVTAYNLAIASAQAGKRTLLVEADLRSPSQAKALKIVSDPHASIEPLRYYSSSSGYVRLAPNIENLYVVPSPGPLRQAAAIVESSELKQLLEDARGRFDFVVVDSPALSRCNDAFLLEPLTDGMIMVTRPGCSQGSILTQALQEYVEAELPLLGAVINGIDKPVPLSYEDDVIEAEKEQEMVYERTDLEVEHDAPTEAMRF